jgi:hypothetical protein
MPMKPPLENPPHRKTTHGAVMSTRLSRLYTWLDANRIGLGDFSTDSMVLAALPRLQALATELAELIEREAGDRSLRPVTYLVHLAADLANLMRRIPSARVPARR